MEESWRDRGERDAQGPKKNRCSPIEQKNESVTLEIPFWETGIVQRDQSKAV